MNIAIRITQVLLALFALNGIYGLALQFFLAPLSSGQRPTAWDVLGSLVAALALGFIIFLLQRYYEIRNKSFSSTKKFLGMALTGASIAIFIGFSIVVLIFVFAFLSL